MADTPRPEMMLADRADWETAQALVAEHGDDAATIAAMNADEASDRLDFRGARRWYRVMLAATWLLHPGGRDPFRVEH